MEKIPDDELKEMHRRMAEHYGSPVLPIKEFCAAFETWVMQLYIKYKEPDQIQYAPQWLKQVNEIKLWIRKSNLLYRLLYVREPLRTEKCPEHKGIWSGIAFEPEQACIHGCHLTGWLPKSP